MFSWALRRAGSWNALRFGKFCLHDQDAFLSQTTQKRMRAKIFRIKRDSTVGTPHQTSHTTQYINVISYRVPTTKQTHDITKYTPYWPNVRKPWLLKACNFIYTSPHSKSKFSITPVNKFLVENSALPGYRQREFLTDVLGQPIGPIFRVQESKINFLFWVSLLKNGFASIYWESLLTREATTSRTANG